MCMHAFYIWQALPVSAPHATCMHACVSMCIQLVATGIEWPIWVKPVTSYRKNPFCTTLLALLKSGIRFLSQPTVCKCVCVCMHCISDRRCLCRPRTLPACMHVCRCVYIIQVCMCVCVYVCMCVYALYIWHALPACIHVCTGVYMYIYLSIYLSVYTYMFL